MEQRSRNLFRPTGKGLWLIKYSWDLRYVNAFRRYSRPKSKVVGNQAEFWTFFSLSQILGGLPSKRYTHFITPASQPVAWKKFCEDTPTSPEVIGAHTLNFKVGLKYLGCALAGLGQSVARVKISGRSTP